MITATLEITKKKLSPCVRNKRRRTTCLYSSSWVNTDKGKTYHQLKKEHIAIVVNKTIDSLLSDDKRAIRFLRNFVKNSNLNSLPC